MASTVKGVGAHFILADALYGRLARAELVATIGRNGDVAPIELSRGGRRVDRHGDRRLKSLCR